MWWNVGKCTIMLLLEGEEKGGEGRERVEE
jgi:hypothetical protein